MTKLLYFARSALSGLRQTPFVHAVAVLTLSIALFAGELARAAQGLTRQLLGSLENEVELTVYLADAASPVEMEAVRARAARDSGGTATLVGPEAALARLKQELGPQGGALDGLPENPLPRTIEVRPPPGPPDIARMRALAQTWGRLPGVAEVDYGREWVDRLASLHRALALGAGLLLALVLLAAVVVVAATLQLAVYARREEIEIQKLVGATDAFVKAPFVIEGMFEGALAAGAALLGLYAFQRGLGPRLADSFGFLLGGVVLPALCAPRHLLEVAGAGVTMGVLGSSIAVGRFLRV